MAISCNITTMCFVSTLRLVPRVPPLTTPLSSPPVPYISRSPPGCLRAHHHIPFTPAPPGHSLPHHFHTPLPPMVVWVAASLAYDGLRIMAAMRRSWVVLIALALVATNALVLVEGSGCHCKGDCTRTEIPAGGERTWHLGEACKKGAHVRKYQRGVRRRVWLHCADPRRPQSYELLR